MKIGGRPPFQAKVKPSCYTVIYVHNIGSKKEVLYLVLERRIMGPAEKEGFDLSSLAIAMDVSRMTLWRIFNGRTVISLFLAIKLASKFRIPLDTLLEDAGYQAKEIRQICDGIKNITFSDARTTSEQKIAG